MLHTSIFALCAGGLVKLTSHVTYSIDDATTWVHELRICDVDEHSSLFVFEVVTKKCFEDLLTKTGQRSERRSCGISLFGFDKDKPFLNTIITHAQKNTNCNYHLYSNQKKYLQDGKQWRLRNVCNKNYSKKEPPKVGRRVLYSILSFCSWLPGQKNEKAKFVHEQFQKSPNSHKWKDAK